MAALRALQDQGVLAELVAQFLDVKVEGHCRIVAVRRGLRPSSCKRMATLYGRLQIRLASYGERIAFGSAATYRASSFQRVDQRLLESVHCRAVVVRMRRGSTDRFTPNGP